MLISLLSEKDRIKFETKMITWEQSIKKGSEPLLTDNTVEERYINKMIENVIELGPYIVIAPKIALAHARPEDGVNKIGLSLLITQEPVLFSEKEEHSANLIFTLAAIDSESHLSLLSDLAQIFAETQNIEQLCQLKTKEEVLNFINQCLGGI